MSPAVVTCRRTVGVARSLYSTAFAVAGFLAASAALLIFNIQAADGGSLRLSALWAVSVSPVLPVLAALLAMDVWSDERRSGRIDILLSSAIRERTYVFGKFLGVWFLLAMSLFVSLFTMGILFAALAPHLLTNVHVIEFLPGFMALLMQGALWCAVSVAASSFCVHAASAAFLSVILTVAIPRGLWAVLMLWSDMGRPCFGDMPFDAQTYDFASGVIPIGVTVSWLVLTGTMLFLASKAVVMRRFAGRGARLFRVSTVTAMALSLVFAALAVVLALRINVSLDVQIAGRSHDMSARLRRILTEARGPVVISCFLSRSDARFRQISHVLRSLKRESAMNGGVELVVRFVDPRWDIGAAERLVSSGATENSVVFEKGRRVAIVRLKDGFNERVCGSAIQRVAMPPRHQNIYWTTGHGEVRFDDYGTWGMSDIARDLMREGYQNRLLDLTDGAQIPKDCALVAVVGAKNGFSRAEFGALDSYLKSGGRLLVLANTVEQGGVVGMLPTWGVRAVPLSVGDTKTITGSDAVVSEFTDHTISAPLKGSRIILERPMAFEPSAVTENVIGADFVEFSALARYGVSAVAAATERGRGAGADIAFRPTRIVVVGDASFVENGQLASRANANRDFFLNCVAYLSGTDAMLDSGVESGLLVSRLDRTGWRHLLVWMVGVAPGCVFVLLMAVILHRRHRR